MSILIAHRGLINGPDENLENKRSTIERALNYRFDVEIDLWYIKNNWYLGHDTPNEKIDIDEFYIIRHSIWIHCKNIDALYQLKKERWAGHYFWHQNDDVTITSTGYFWTYPNKQITSNSILLLPELSYELNENFKFQNCYGICSDYVLKLKELQNL